MHKRTVGFTAIHRKVGKKHKNSFGCLDNVDGQDLLALFYSWIDNLNPDELVDETRGSYMNITKIEPMGRTVLVVVEAGRFGEAGNTRNVRTHKISHKRTTDDAAAEKCRFLFTVPTGSTAGLFAVESVAGSAGAYALIEMFKSACNQRWPDDWWPTARVYEKKDWIDAAELRSLTAVYYAWERNINSSTHPILVTGKVQQTLHPGDSGEYLPKRLLRELRAGEINASTVVGFAEDREPDKVFADITHKGRHKEIDLSNERTPTVRIVMTEAGQQAYDDGRFRNECVKLQVDLFKGMTGRAQPTSVSVGAWDTEALNTTWG